jgi:2-methylcitrate dehydratase PrpD
VTSSRASNCERTYQRVPSATQEIAKFSSSLTYEQIPPHVSSAAAEHILDVVGVGLAAHALGGADHALAAMLEDAQCGAATVIGYPDGLPPASAAFVNGALCHSLDYDDTHSDSICHVSVVVAPAALAVAQARHAPGTELLAAFVLGAELVTRIGAAAAPAYMKQGFHPTSVCGIFGAAAAAARLSGLDAARTADALGIAGSMASGLFEYLADGSTTKTLHPGWAAHAGILAARLAAHGATGPASVLEGRFGVMATYFRQDRGSELARPLADLGERWETPRIAFKPYPACHFIHACLDAAAKAANSARFLADEIDEVVVRIPEAGVPLVLEPRQEKIAPRTPYAAKFSLQYSVAAMLVLGRVGLDTYGAAAINDPNVLDLAGKVSYQVGSFDTYPEALPGAITIRTRLGETLSATVPFQRGGPDNPMSHEDVRAKFAQTASLALPSDCVQRLAETILSLDEQDDLSDAFAELGMANSRPLLAAQGVPKH